MARFYELLGRFFLDSDVRALGVELDKSNISGAKVVGRGTIMVDGKVIASSEEFKKLKQSAKRVVNAKSSSPA